MYLINQQKNKLPLNNHNKHIIIVGNIRRLYSIIVLLTLSVSILLIPKIVYADSKNGTTNTQNSPKITIEEREKLVNCHNDAKPDECLKINPLVGYTLILINFLAAGVGVIVTIMIIIGGIQYASAGPNPQAIQMAKKKITNAIIALVAFFFLYAFLQYLIPGGIF